MKKLSLFFFCILVQSAYAIDYTISFTGSGASTNIDSVRVQNITQGTSIVLPAGNVLNLKDMNSGFEHLNVLNDATWITRNNAGADILNFHAAVSGEYFIEVYDTEGKKVLRKTETLLSEQNTFELSFPQGVFIINIFGQGKSYSAKYFNHTSSTNHPEIRYAGSSKMPEYNAQKSKIANNTSTINYQNDDLLIFTGFSGDFRTLVSNSPKNSKTINFEFVECRDAAGKNYTVTHIGAQTWMAENLAYLPVAASNLSVGSEDAGNEGKPFYYVFQQGQYGVHYNWFAASKAAPSGWRLPGETDWAVLSDYLGGEEIAGDKMKSNVGFSGATNSSCFSGLPGGIRYDGLFNQTGTTGCWWSSTRYNSSAAYVWALINNKPELAHGYFQDFCGINVRCVKDAIGISTTIVSGITKTTATCGGDITSEGGSSIISRGVVWCTSQNPTLENNTGKTTDGSGNGNFISNLTGLNPNTTYYVRAYAANSFGVRYGNQFTFTTLSEIGTYTLNDYLGEFSIQCKIGDDASYSSFSPVVISSFTDEDGIWVYIEGLYMGKPWHIAYGKWDEAGQCVRLQGGYYSGKNTFSFYSEPTINYFSVFSPVYLDESIQRFYPLYGGDANYGIAKLVKNSSGKIIFEGADPDKNNRLANAFIYRYYLADTKEYKSYFSICSNITLTPSSTSSKVKQNNEINIKKKDRILLSNKNTEISSSHPSASVINE